MSRLIENKINDAVVEKFKDVEHTLLTHYLRTEDNNGIGIVQGVRDVVQGVVCIKRGGKQVTFDYSWGLGNVTTRRYKKLGNYIRNYMGQQVCRQVWRASKMLGRVMENTVPREMYIYTCLSDYLYALILEARALFESFDEWCANYGYNIDSIKASNLFSACRETGRKLLEIFSHEELVELNILLQDY